MGHTPPQFSLTTLGSLRLEGPSGELLAGRRKEFALLAYLARHSPRAVSREKLATLLWGERDEAKAKQSLRHALHQLRRALGEAIDVSNGSIRVLPDAIRLDAALLERGVAEGRLTEALALWHGEFLSGSEDLGHEEFRSWLEGEREALRRILPGAFEQLTSQARLAKRHTDELEWARRWSECCPFDDTAETCLIEALLAAGAAGDARIAHAAFTARLRSELDRAPSADSLRLEREIDRALQHTADRHRGSAGSFSPDLVGRDSVLALLGELWSRARKDPALALIVGEEGSGKSRVCGDFARRIQSAGKSNLVLEIRALDHDTTAEGSTIRRLISALVETSAIEDAPNRSLVELSRIAPELRRRFPQLASPAENSNTESALRAVFRAIASATPTLVIIDDFAAADSPSKELTLSLARALPPGMMLVLTVRPDQVAGTDLLRELSRLPSARRIKLSPLTREEIAILVESVLSLSPEDRDTVAERLSVESGGNPFYALELMSAFAESGMLTPAVRGRRALAGGFKSQALPLPPSLRAAIRLRLAQLSEPAGKVLDAAARAEKPIASAAVQRSTGLTTEDFQPAIDELLSRGLLRLQQDGRGGYEFTHDLIGRVAAERKNGASLNGQHLVEPPVLIRRRVMRNRLGQAGLALAVVAAILFQSTRSFPTTPTPPPTPVEDLRIVVAAFANETGEAQFDRLGRITADFLTRGIARTGLISVLPPVSGASAADSPGSSMLPEEFPKLSPSIRPSMVITGAIYRSGDSIRFDAQIMDARAGKVVRVVDPVVVVAS